MLARISFFLGVLLISIPYVAFSSEGVSPEPFFTRWDRATYVFEGKITNIVPSLEKIGGDFKPYVNINFKKAKMRILNAHKGDLRNRKEVDVYYFTSPVGLQEGDKDLISDSFDFYKSKDEPVLVYLREAEGKLLASVRYGIFPKNSKAFYEPETAAISAIKSGKSEREIVELLWSDERWQYRKQLRENGKISR